MASYPYSSAPPPCKNTTSSPILHPPPPPPPPACNHTSPPPPYSPSPPSLSPTPCNCNKPPPTVLPPPHLPPPPPPSASLSPPPLPPPPSRYFPPVVHSPPPPSPSQPSPILPPPSPPSPSPPSSDCSPPLPSKSPPPKPSKIKASPVPTPSLQPAAPPSYSSPQTPLHSPLSPEPPLCHCPCSSPWAIPPSIPPNYYAPAPSPLSSGNNQQRTVIVTAFVSLGGVFFLAFIVIGLLSMAMKKKMLSIPRLSGRPRVPETDQLSHGERQEHVQEFQSIPAGTEHVIEMGGDHDSKVQEVSADSAPPDQGIVQQGEAGQRIPSETEKKSTDSNVKRNPIGDDQGKVDDSDMKLGEPSGEQSGDKFEDVDEGKSNEGNNKPLGDHTDATPNEESESNTIQEESNEGASNESQKKPRLPKIKKQTGGKAGKEKHSGIPQFLNAALTFDSDVMEQTEDVDSDEKQVSGTEAQDDNKAELLSDDINHEDEQVAEERDGKSLSDQTESNKANSAQDVNEGSNAEGEESKDSKKKVRLPKQNKSASSRTKTGKQKYSKIGQVLNVAQKFDQDEAEQSQDGDNDQEQVSEHEAQDDDKVLHSDGANYADEKVDSPTEEERDPEERDDKPLSDQTETNKTDSPQDVNKGSNAVGGESSNSKKKYRLPIENKSSSRSAKKGKEKHSGFRKLVNVAPTFDPDEEEQSQDVDNDQEQAGEPEAQNDDKECPSDGDEKVEPPFEDEQEAVEDDDKSSINQTETNKTGAAQDVSEGSNVVRGESSDSTKKLCLPKKSKSSSRRAKMGKEKQYGILQALTTTGTPGTLDLNEVDQYQDGDDKEQGSEFEAQNDDKELLLDGTTYADEEAESPIEDEQDAEERDGKALSDQTEINKMDSAQDVNEKSNAVGEESSDSRLPKKNKSASHSTNKGKGKPFSSSGATKGKEKHHGIRQVPTAGGKSNLGGAKSFQDGDNDEEPYDEELYEPQPKEDDTELIAGGSKSAVDTEQADADEPEVDEHHGEPLNSRQSERFIEDYAQHVEEESGTFEEDAPQVESNDTGEVIQLESLEHDEKLDSGGSNDTSEEVVPPTNADADVSNECEPKSLENQSERDSRDATEDAEQDSTAIKEDSNDRSRKPIGKQSYSDNANAIQDVEKPYARKEDPIYLKRKQALKKGRGSSNRSHPQGEVHDSNFGKLLNETGDAYSEALQSQEDDNEGLQMEESELQHDDEDLNSGGNDSSRAMVSLDDVEGEVEVPDLFASAQGSKQALSNPVVLVGGDYKDDKAKGHEMKSGSSKKDLQERRQRTQAKKNFNLEKIGTAASRGDPDMAMVSFDDEEQESEPVASNVDSYLGQLQRSAREIEQSPNFFGNLTTKSDIDPTEELKSLGEGYKGKKAEVHKLSKESRRIKGQVKGSGTKIEPPKLNQIVTGRIDEELGILGKGLECLGGNQAGGSGKDVAGFDQTSRVPQQFSSLVQSLAATDEGDPNPELEFGEDDRVMESDLSLQEHSAGEGKPSTDDQSVFVTAEDDSDVLQFLENEYDEEPAESHRDIRAGKPPSRPRATNLRGKRRA